MDSENVDQLNFLQISLKNRDLEEVRLPYRSRQEKHQTRAGPSCHRTPQHSCTVSSWKPYVPAVVTGVLSTVCIIGGNAIGTRRTAALAAAYKISETALHEYKDAIVETAGEEKAKEVKEKVAQNKLDKNPVVEKQIIVTNKGTFLCYDSLSGRYFQSDIETIRKAQNDINDYLFSEDYASLNMFYDFLGLEHTRLGAELGWKIDSGTLQIEFDSTLASDKSQGIAPGTPCLVLDYNVAPKYEFDKMSY